jgi:hypothetical protein
MPHTNKSPSTSWKDSKVGTDQTCSCCKDDRVNHGKEPRPLVFVMVAGKAAPVVFCTFCDGDAIIGAKAIESKAAGS